MLSLVGVGKHFGARSLFSGVNLTIGVSERIGLVGPNGSGKTTLLEILAGRADADEGTVARNKRATIGYLLQEVPLTKQATLFDEMLSGAEKIDHMRRRLALLEEEMRSASDPDEIGALAEEHGEIERRFDQSGGYDLPTEAKRILSGLAFRERDLGRPLAEFSGGWLMRLQLARLLLTEPDLLLLDEPTNFLDLESVIWLEEYLRAYSGSLVLVSHDRVLLNRLARRIVEIERGKVTAYTGNYEAYAEARRVRDEGLVAAKKSQDRKIAQTERFIARYRVRKDTAKRVQSRIKMLEKMERIEAPGSRKSIDFAFPEPPRAGRVPIELRSVSKSYGDIRVYERLDWRIEREERVVLVGANGAGKSTLLKMLAGTVRPDAGERVLGHNVKVAYYAQHQVETLDYAKTILDEILDWAPDLNQQRARAILGRFLFSGDDVFKKIEVLSGGEKARVALVKLLLRPPNLLLLDEPTSHLDIDSRDVLAGALEEFTGSLVMISHDRHFIDRLASRVDEVAGGAVRVHLGKYGDFLAKKEAARAAEKAASEAAAPARRPAEGSEADLSDAERGARGKKSREERRREAEARNERYRRVAPLRDEIESVLAEIEALERRRGEIEGAMASSDFYAKEADFGETFRAYRELKAEIDSKTARWEELTERLEETERELETGEEEA
ncbi:MAG: ABC transporter ATP-binding protein [Candidatus Latescibacterota bacterium]|nr:MAG: ABC transporter ATP-binding protein [Candidatus Latescibacterota bacterium]